MTDLAELVATSDVSRLNRMGAGTASVHPHTWHVLAAARAEILAQLGPSPAHVDDIVRQTGVSAGLLRMVLLELELAGRLERHPGDRVALLPEWLEAD